MVVHVSNKLTWRGEGDELNDNKTDVTKDKAVNETTVKKIHLKSEIEFFITHPKFGEKIVTNGYESSGVNGAAAFCHRSSNPF